MTAEPRWLAAEAVRSFHAELIRAFGGAEGLRDPALLDAALARPRHVHGYAGGDLHACACAYAHAIVKNHAFVDGNKRVAFVATRVFLIMNGVRFDPPEAEAVVMIEGLASDEVSQDEFVHWLKKHSRGVSRRRRVSRKSSQRSRTKRPR